MTEQDATRIATEIDDTGTAQGRYWVSWYHAPNLTGFTLVSPWWVSGFDMLDNETICAAVIATGEAEARDMIFAVYDARPETLRFRFVDHQPADWSPFCDRFPRADWMVWP